MKRIFNNWQAKLGSILLAILFYVNLQNSKILVKEINIPIEYPKLNGSLTVSKASDKTFPVKVEGVREYVNYYSQFLKAHVNASDLKPGENSVSLYRISGAPAGLRITKLKDKVKVIVESNSGKFLPIDVKFTGDLPPNYVKTGPFISPSLIHVSGPPGVLENLGKINFPPISLKDKTESFSIKHKLPDFPAGVKVRDNVKEVTVRVNIFASASNAGETLLLGIPIKCQSLDKNLEAEFSEPEVSVKLQSKTPLKSIQVIKGLSASVVCSHKYDPKTKKILPDNKPVFAKIKLTKASSLKAVDILGVFPDRISILYKIKPDKDKSAGEEGDNGEEENTIEPDSNPELLEEE
ncbi:YbbR-like domain-containing protein [Leptospira sp. 201903071]|uniref:CdaR family protein n=1 Tax=Leptospira ainazelensis TaxID=2810034 RepID=UPI001964F307|nr:YbbR-like domain-containing protein [Leptospira ainazelensis]MBM9500236.1 YbbR-like domain-containing protein [Leptospira ainazelensis]